MPIYEYKCSACGEQFEVSQKMSDAPLSLCNACGGKLKKLITSTSFVLKGNGWYVTDYPSDARKQAMEKKKEPAESKDAKPEQKTAAEKKEPVSAK